MKLTDNQRSAVEHRGSNVLLAASAGSGKTAVLSRRCAELISDPRTPCSVDQILVATFTRAAAAEMRIRIQEQLREARGRTADAALREHLARQEILLDTADIGTIDAWCGRVVREHFEAAHVDPGFGTMAPGDAILVRGHLLDDLFAWIVQDEDDLAERTRGWVRRHKRPNTDFLRDMVLALNRYREHLINPREWFERQREIATADPQQAQQVAQRLLAHALRRECVFQREQLGLLLRRIENAKAKELLDAYGESLRSWSAELAHSDRLDDVSVEIADYKIKKPKSLSAADDAILTEIRERWLEKRLKKKWPAQELEEAVASAAETAALLDLLLRLETRFEQSIREQKARRGEYEFGDIQRLALDLLGDPAPGQRRTPTELAGLLRRRYEHVLVDECQDTSPMQVELIRLVSRSEPGATNRFLVGDVKQSIYGFREAEPRLFSELADALSAGREEGRLLRLPDNFRTHADLLEPLNEMFARLFDHELGGTDYGPDERLVACRAEIANDTLDHAPRLEIRIVDADTFGGAGSQLEADVPRERIEREARLLAERLNELMETGTRVPRLDADNNPRLEALRWSDVVVLMRKARFTAAQAAAELRNCGVPAVAAERESPFECREVMDVRNVLSLIDNPCQDLPLASYLRSPMSGIDERGLLTVRRAAPRADFFDAVQTCRRESEDEALRRDLDRAMTRLDRWSRLARHVDLAQLINRIIRETGLEHFALAQPGGDHRAAMLEALLPLAETCARAGDGPAEFTLRLDELIDAEHTPSGASPMPKDVLRVMTIHAAKGLEFPVVCLLGSGTEFTRSPRSADVSCDAELGIGLRFTDYPRRADLVSAARLVITDQQGKRDLEEELRLLYVAATRARELFIMVGHAKAEQWDELAIRDFGPNASLPLITRMSADSPLHWAMLAVAAAGLHTNDGAGAALVTCASELPKPPPAAAPSVTTPTPLTPEDQRWIDTARRRIEADPDRGGSLTPATVSVSELKRRAGGDTGDRRHEQRPALALSRPRFAQPDDVSDPLALGTTVHRFLELADLTRLSTADEVRREIESLTRDGPLDARDAERINPADLVWLGGTEIGRILARYAEQSLREMPFVRALEDESSGERVILRGIIDCLVDTPDGLILIDYKTDPFRDERDWAERLAGYGIQLRAYAEATAQLFDKPVIGAKLVFLRARRVEDVALPKA